MGQVPTKYATDDPELIKLLQSVMGNKSAANLFWSCLLDEPVPPFELPIDANHMKCVNIENQELGSIMSDDVRINLDLFCIELGVSRFSVILCVFALLMERYSKCGEFLIRHNYGLTGSKFRILEFPVTKVSLSDANLSFAEFVCVQNEIVQKSSYHLCLPVLPLDWQLDNFLGVFLLHPPSGHTCDFVNKGVAACKLSLVVELVSPSDICLRLHYSPELIEFRFAQDIFANFIFTLQSCLSSHLKNGCSSNIPVVACESDISDILNPDSNIVNFPEVDMSLDALIVAQSIRTPLRTAVKQFGPSPVSLTYSALVASARCLAIRLALAPGSKVAILLPRGVNQVVAILGILIANCVYVPLDPESHPPDRIDFVLRDACVAAIVSESHVAAARPFAGKVATVLLDEPYMTNACWDESSSYSTTDKLCYVIYTSGSTGTPKGVLVPHKGIVNDIYCVFRKYMQSDFSFISNVVFSTNICFDAHVDEVFLPLVFGGTITALHAAISSEESAKILTNSNFSFVQATPSVFSVIDIPPSVKAVLIGGEALTASCLAKVSAPGRLILNGYGPTETTNESSIHVVRDLADFKSIGTPIWNTQFYILSHPTVHAPMGGWGELFIGGTGVTLGYQNLPLQTASSFLADTNMPGVVYKTGDIVRLNRRTGCVEFRGRKNTCTQIKLRGYRIELGEISAQILKMNPFVTDCHVVFEKGQIGAYLQGPIDQLKFGSLPTYMHPTRFVFLDAFPRSVAGKLDTKRFPPFGSKAESTDLEPFERIVAESFSTCLGEPIGDNLANFFASGGNSLNVILLQSLIFEKTKIKIKLQTLFQLQTVRNIAQFLEPQKKPKFFGIFVPLSAGSLGIPLLCIHAAGGQVHTYAYLASRLPHVVGIQDPSLVIERKKYASFEKLAAIYANNIHSTYPDGPLFLAGHSSGGSLAFETAKILESKYKRFLPCVFMFDTDFPNNEKSSDQIERIDEIRHYLYHGWKEGLMHDYLSAITAGSNSKLVKLLKAVLPSGTECPKNSNSSGSADLLRMISLLDHHLQIEKKYVPTGWAKFDIVLFRPHHDISEWGSLTRGRVITVDVPDANHYNIIRPPAVDVLTTVILHVMEQSSARVRE